VIAPAGHHCNGRSGHLNATIGGEDMGSMAQTGLLLVPSDALGHTWALPTWGSRGQGLPPETGMRHLKEGNYQLEIARSILECKGVTPDASASILECVDHLWNAVCILKCEKSTRRSELKNTI